MITPFNIYWTILFVIQFIIPFIVAAKTKGKNREEKLRIVKWFAVFAAIHWIFYKVSLFLDPDYPNFNIWNELPLYHCNTILWLGIIAAIYDIKAIMDYGFYIGIPCAILALMMPNLDFVSLPFFSFRAFGFYGTHMCVIILGLLFVTMGLTEISYKSVLRATLCFVIMTVAIHLVNIILRSTVFPEASYYYTFGFDENFLLRAFMRFIPIPLLYMTPIFIGSFIVCSLETLIILSLKKLFKNRETSKGQEYTPEGRLYS